MRRQHENERAVVPGNRPRAQASAVGTPRTTQRVVTITPTLRLFHIASTSTLCWNSCRYQWSVKPSGGKLTKARVSKEMITTMTEGATSIASARIATRTISPRPSLSAMLGESRRLMRSASLRPAGEAVGDERDRDEDDQAGHHQDQRCDRALAPLQRVDDLLVDHGRRVQVVTAARICGTTKVV